MFQWHLPILVELFELGATVLEPDFHLDRRKKELLVSLSACLKDPSTQPSLEKAKPYPASWGGGGTRQNSRALTPKPVSFFPVGEELCGLEYSAGPVVCHF